MSNPTGSTGFLPFNTSPISSAGYSEEGEPFAKRQALMPESGGVENTSQTVSWVQDTAQYTDTAPASRTRTIDEYEISHQRSNRHIKRLRSQRKKANEELNQKKEEVKRLNKKYKEAVQNLASYEAQVNELKSRLSKSENYETDIGLLEISVKDYVKRIKILNDTNEKNRSELKYQKSINRDSAEENKKLDEAYGKVKLELDQLKEKLQDKDGKLKQLGSELSLSLRNYQEVNEELMKSNEKINQLEESLGEKNKKLEELSDELEETLLDNEDLDSEAEDFYQELKEQDRALNGQLKSIFDLTAQLEDINTDQERDDALCRNAQLQEKVEQLTASNTWLNNVVENKKLEVQKLQKLAESQGSTLKEQFRISRNLMQQVDDCKKDLSYNEALHAKTKEILEATRDSLKTELANVELKYSESENELKTLKSAFEQSENNLKAKLGQLERQAAKKDDENTSLRQELEQQKTELTEDISKKQEEFKQAEGELNRRIAQYKNEESYLKAEMERQKSEFQKKQETYDQNQNRLQTVLEQAKQQLSVTKEKIDSYVENKRALEQSENNLKAKLGQLEAQTAKKDGENTRLRQELEQQKKKLTNDLSKKQEEFEQAEGELKRQIAQYKDEKSYLEAEMERQKCELLKQQVTYDQNQNRLQKNLEQAKQQLASTKENNTKLEGEIRQQQNEFSARQKTFEQELSEMAAKLKLVESNLSAAEQEKERLTSINAEQKSVQENLQCRLNEAVSLNRDQIELEKQAQESIQNAIAQENKKHQKEVAQLKASQKRNIAELSEQLSSVNKELAEAKEQLQQQADMLTLATAENKELEAKSMSSADAQEEVGMTLEELKTLLIKEQMEKKDLQDELSELQKERNGDKSVQKGSSKPKGTQRQLQAEIETLKHKLGVYTTVFGVLSPQYEELARRMKR